LKQEAAGFRDWGKVQFYEYPSQDWSVLLPSLSEQERDLVGSLVKYESGSRMSASKVRQQARLEDVANLLSGPRACLLFVVSIGSGCWSAIFASRRDVEERGNSARVEHIVSSMTKSVRI